MGGVRWTGAAGRGNDPRMNPRSSPLSPDLFSPVRVGPDELPNRIVMAPMTRSRAGPGEVPTALMATYYAQRASAGLIVSEGTQITPQGQGYPGTPGIHSAEQIEGWKRVTGATHDRGGRGFCPLLPLRYVSPPRPAAR